MNLLKIAGLAKGQIWLEWCEGKNNKGKRIKGENKGRKLNIGIVGKRNVCYIVDMGKP